MVMKGACSQITGAIAVGQRRVVTSQPPLATGDLYNIFRRPNAAFSCQQIGSLRCFSSWQSRWRLVSVARAGRMASVGLFGPPHALPLVMQLFKIAGESVIGFGLLLGGVGAQCAYGQTKPDNTAQNKRDQNPDEATADQQKMNAADRDTTARIRKSIMADKSLSTYAHNVKIISQDGTVTLKGPVRSDDEVQSIVSKATDVTGSAAKVINQMSVARTSNR